MLKLSYLNKTYQYESVMKLLLQKYFTLAAEKAKRQGTNQLISRAKTKTLVLYARGTGLVGDTVQF